VHPVNKIASERQHEDRKYQKSHIQDRAPHEKPCQHLNIHGAAPLKYKILTPLW